jgi:hypothetical protein
MLSAIACPSFAVSLCKKVKIGELTKESYNLAPIKLPINEPNTPYKKPKPRYVAFLSCGAISPRYEIYFGCAVISPKEKTNNPAINTHIFELNANKNIPNVAMVKPVIIVGIAGVRCTIFETRNCSRMIVPALTTTTCDTLNCQSIPNKSLMKAFSGVVSTKVLTYHSTVPNI